MEQHPHIGFFIPLQHNSSVYGSNLTKQPAPVPPLGINLGNRKLDVQANGDKPSTGVRHVLSLSLSWLLDHIYSVFSRLVLSMVQGLTFARQRNIFTDTIQNEVVPVTWVNLMDPNVTLLTTSGIFVQPEDPAASMGLKQV